MIESSGTANGHSASRVARYIATPTPALVKPALYSAKSMSAVMPRRTRRSRRGIVDVRCQIRAARMNVESSATPEDQLVEGVVGAHRFAIARRDVKGGPEVGRHSSEVLSGDEPQASECEEPAGDERCD